MQKGTIGVTTENIFPVIKKFLYSDHEIFLRELVSNMYQYQLSPEYLVWAFWELRIYCYKSD